MRDNDKRCSTGSTRGWISAPTRRLVVWLVGFALLIAAGADAGAQAADEPLLLLRAPTLSKHTVAFQYGDEIWTVDRTGGTAHLLAGGPGKLSGPMYSPDGSMIAYTGNYDGNTDVYVVPATGGQPQRLTYHPGADTVVGWTPDGKRVLFSSHRHAYSDPAQLYTVGLAGGGLAHQLPLAEAELGSYSPTADRLAYVPGFQWEPFWKSYTGGQYTRIWLADLADSRVERVPNKGYSDNDPMWIGDTVYFLSNRNGPITLFAYHTKTKKITRMLDNSGFDLTSAAAGPGGIVYSQFGQLHIYDLASGKARAVPVRLAGDMPQRRAHYQKVVEQIEGSAISPTGVRAAFGAYGEILTVPADTDRGAIQNLTHRPGAMARQPAWSPKGQRVAYFSDSHGEYDLYIRDQKGSGPARRIALGADDAFYDAPRWSPDSKRLLFGDQKLNLWMVDLTAKDPKPVKIAHDNYAQLHQFDARWSPDGRFIVFTKVLSNYLHAVYAYSLDDKQTHQITDGQSDCLYPVFSDDGKTLYFTSGTNTALTHGWLDMTSMQRPVTRNVYAATLRADTASPVAPKPSFEKPGGDNPDKSQKTDKKTGSDSKKAGSGSDKTAAADRVHIDFKGLQARAVPLKIEAANYAGLAAGKNGVLYVEKMPLVQMQESPGDSGPPLTVLQYQIDDDKTKTLVDGVSDVSFSADHAKMLYRKGPTDWFIQKTQPKADAKKLAVADMRIYVTPQAQWAQMYREAWRMQRAFFYNPIYDGLDINAAEKLFAHYLPGIASRDDLSFLFEQMMSYMSVGHMFIRGGHEPEMDDIKVGLLGANYAVAHGRYRITRIFKGDDWNPDSYAPLAQPGLKIKTGDYLLAVNGEPLHARQNLYQAFENQAGNEVTLAVGPKVDGSGSHTVTVRTIPSEGDLRNQAWIDHNRAVVDKMSGGRLGYVYLPDTHWGGYANFNRYFFSQVDKQGVIIDERFNHGGLLSDYIIQYLKRRPMTLNITRWGQDAVTPPEAIFGPKVMLINQFSGSGGDALPWYFKTDHIGTLVGKRTWGGLVGIGGFPKLMDGGTITAPNTAVVGLDGTFPVENHGIAPDVDVWQNPAKMRQGHDPQLERAVGIALKQLKADPPRQYKRPPWRDYHPQLPALPTPAVPDKPAS